MNDDKHPMLAVIAWCGALMIIMGLSVVMGILIYQGLLETFATQGALIGGAATAVIVGTIIVVIAFCAEALINWKGSD